MRRYLKIIITAAVCIIIAVVALGIYRIFFADNLLQKDEVIVVQPKSSFQQVLDTLEAHNVLKSQWSFRMAAKVLKFKTMHTGKYNISQCASNWELITLLRKGQHFPVKFTFNNIRTKEQFARRTENKFFFTPDNLLSLLSDNDFLKQYDLKDTTALCLFIPNTYEFYYDITAEEFVERMYKYYKKFWDEERLQMADSIGLTPVEVTTLASIVEEENHRPAEKAIIAGLYMNRLHKDMLLQSDPTVKYAIGDFSRQRILAKDLEINSPYNTYKYKGLPPGPIRIPEGSTIDSVLNFTHHNFLYMCAKEDFSGYHNFAETANEHLRNAAKYRNALNKKNIRK